VLRWPRPLNRDVRGGPVDVARIVGRGHDRERSEILFEPRSLGGSRDRYDPRLLRQQPCEGNLSGVASFRFAIEPSIAWFAFLASVLTGAEGDEWYALRRPAP
jgi:hypothetical protein